jgi:hypothetical protein
LPTDFQLTVIWHQIEVPFGYLDTKMFIIGIHQGLGQFEVFIKEVYLSPLATPGYFRRRKDEPQRGEGLTEFLGGT